MSTCPECGNLLPPGIAAGACPKCLLSLGFQNVLPARSDGPSLIPDKLREKAGDRIGHYRLLEVIGEGAFGVVWMAEQEVPVRRRVALKIIKLGMDTRAVVARFEAERQALALMDHPNIARVFDGGATESGRPYFVMELVRGVPLTDFCEARRLSTTDRIQLFTSVCAAVQHAHQKGVIHRDLKPSNILVTEHDGKPVTKVIDFGIAKATEQRLTDKTLFTQFNQFIGTPAYMSPEQTGLGGLDLDTRTDVYSLGVILYELVTGQTPFNSRELSRAGIEVAQKVIRESDPPRPSTRLSTLSRADLLNVAANRGQSAENLTRSIRGELDWITLKALEKDRTQRYQSASDLAADLERFLRNEAITAAPPTWAYQFQKFARRNRTALLTAAAFVFVLLAGTVVSTWLAFRATRLAQSEQRARADAQGNLAQARLNAYASEMNVAQQALAENNLERALQLLDRQRPKGGETNDLRGFEWRYLWQLCQPNHLALLQDAAPGHYPDAALAVSPDGKWMVYNSTNSVAVREMQTQRLETRLPIAAQDFSFSPDGRILAAAHLWNPPIRLWNTRTWDEIAAPALEGTLAPAVYSPDGKWLICGDSTGTTLQLRRTDTYQIVATCPATPLLSVSLRDALAFSPDSQWLVTPWMKVLRHSQGSGLILWKIPTLEKSAELFIPDIPLQGARFLPDGKHLITPSWLGHLAVWDLEANPPRVIQLEREHSTYIPSIVLSPDGRTFATGSGDQSICLWDASTRKRIARFRGHRREVWGLGMTPDGDTLASCSLDGTVRFWSGHPANGGDVTDEAGDIAGFTADGRSVVLAPGEDDYRWQVVTGTNRVSIPIPEDPPLQFDFIRPYAVTGQQPLAAIGRTHGKLELWDLAAKRLLASWNPGTERITSVAFSPNGLSVLSGDDAGIVRMFQPGKSSEDWELKVLNGGVTALVFSPDGQWLATGNQNSHKTRIWDLKTRTQLTLIPVEANKVAFAPDGKSLVTCTVEGNEARIWQLPSGRQLAALKGHVGGMTEAAFSPDGRTLATGAYDGRIKLWNWAMKQEVGTLPYPGMITAMQFSPDGQTLAASVWTSPGYRAVLFRAPSLAEIDKAEVNRAR